MSVQNFAKKDPFAVDDIDDEQDLAKSTKEFSSAKSQQSDSIHIRIQQRNGRKTLTTIQGLPSEFDPKKILKWAKKEFACNGSVVDDEEYGSVVQLQGDQRQKIADLLAEEGISKAQIHIHGF